MFFQVLITSLYVALFSILIWRSSFFKIDGVPKIYFIATFYLKVCVGVFGWMLYTKYYPSNDAIGFFKDGELLYELFYKDKKAFFELFFGLESTSPVLPNLLTWNEGYMDFIVNDSRTMVRLNALIRFFSFGAYHVHTVVFCFLSLFGSTYILKAALSKITANKAVLFLVIFLSPSVLFWSSLVLKEALVFFAIGLLLYYTEFGTRITYTKKGLFFSFLGALLLLFTKPHLFLVFLPFLLINKMIIRFGWKNALKTYAIFYVSVFVLIAGIHFFSPSNSPVRMLQQKQMLFIKQSRGGVYLYSSGYHVYVDHASRNIVLDYVNDSTCRLKEGYTFKKFILNTDDTLLVEPKDYQVDYKIVYDSRPAGSYVQGDELNGSFGQFLLLIPKKIGSVFMLTDAYEQSGWLVCLAILESSFYLLGLFFVLCFAHIRKDQLVLVLFLGSLICSLYAMIGLTSPVVGAIVRYKVDVATFLGLLILLVFDKEKWNLFRNKFRSKN